MPAGSLSFLAAFYIFATEKYLIIGLIVLATHATLYNFQFARRESTDKHYLKNIICFYLLLLMVLMSIGIGWHLLPLFSDHLLQRLLFTSNGFAFWVMTFIVAISVVGNIINLFVSSPEGKINLFSYLAEAIMLCYIIAVSVAQYQDITSQAAPLQLHSSKRLLWTMPSVWQPPDAISLLINPRQ